MRLTLHILTRNWGKPEDFRYQAWRAEAGEAWWWRSLFKVFFLQGALMWMIGAPLLAAQHGATPNQLTFMDHVAIPVWLVGFFFETVGDWQLARFKANPANKGRLLNTGVWRYTRHPNYFGDAAQWWGFYLSEAEAARPGKGSERIQTQNGSLFTYAFNPDRFFNNDRSCLCCLPAAGDCGTYSQTFGCFPE